MRARGVLRRLGRAAAYGAAVLLLFEMVSRAFLSSEALFLRVASPQTEPSWRLQWVRRHRHLAYLSLRPRFVHHRQQGGRLETQEHWGPGEHALAAEGIAEFLHQRGLLRLEASRDPAAGL